LVVRRTCKFRRCAIIEFIPVDFQPDWLRQAGVTTDLSRAVALTTLAKIELSRPCSCAP
jgi:hypothetical protein